MPIFQDAAAEILKLRLRPRVLVSGVLHQGSKIVFGGGSKSFKTWALADLSVSIATKSEWWGLQTKAGKVLYLNFEIQDCFFYDRIEAICKAKGVTLEAGTLMCVNLRGHPANFSAILARVADRISGQDYSLIVVDPVYKGLSGRDENKAGDITELMNEIEVLGVRTGAATAFGAHFSKGNQSAKESIDRISGSGVFARDPDSILVMTRHETDDAFTIEATLRNFPPLAPFCVRWEYPLLRRADNLDPEKLKKAIGRKKQFEEQKLLDLLQDRDLTTTEFKDKADEQLGMSKSGFYRMLDQAERTKKIEKSKVNEKWHLAAQVP